MPNETILDLYLEEEDVLEIGLEEEDILQISLYSEDVFSIELIDNGIIQEKDYEKLINQPSVNGEILIGDKTFEQLGRENMRNKAIKDLIDEQWENIFGG